MSKENRVSDERLAKFIDTCRAMGDAGDGARYAWWDDLTTALTELQSLRSKPVAGVEVKPLEWSKTSYGRPEVETVVGVYRVFEHVDGGWAATFKTFNLVDAHGRKNFATEHEALAAAEADYRQRILSTLSLPAQDLVAKPYAFEFGKSNGDGTYCVIIERGDEGYVERFAVKDWPIKPLYASAQPEAVITEEMVERAYDAFVAACEWSDWDEPEVRGYVRAALEAALKEA